MRKSTEQQAAKYSSYVCQKVVNRPVSFSGNNDIGKPRRLGLLSVQDPGYPGLMLFTSLVKKQVERCGGTFVAEGGYKYPYSVGSVDEARPQAATENMATFQAKGVTTVLWTGGWEEKHTKAAASLNYRPEWIMASDGEIDEYGVAQLQEPTVWSNAWIVSEASRYGTYRASDKCYGALREVDRSFPEADARFVCAIGFPYEASRQLFTGIQLAGPTLTPPKVDEGFRAIPPRPSNDPGTPSCYYEPGDYSCVKDAQASWWDSTATANNNRKGCWKMTEGGRRYLAGQWPRGDVLAQKNTAKDACNGWDPTFLG